MRGICVYTERLLVSNYRRFYGGVKVEGGGNAGNLAVKISKDEILQSYPSINSDDIQAVIAYTAELARERVVSLQARPAR